MKRTREQINERMHQVCNHFISGGKVVIKDKADGVVKESGIAAVYSDNTVVLRDCIHSEYDIFCITLIPTDTQ